MVKKILLMLLFLLLISTAYSYEIEIKVKPSFKEGERIYFDYSIISETSNEIVYTPSVICQDATSSILQDKTAVLEANSLFKEKYDFLIVDDSIEPQTCTAQLKITSPVVQKAKKNFKIETNPSFYFDISLNKKIFVKKEEINLDYNSEVSNPTITAVLTLSDKTTKQITLPYSFKPEQIGTYELEVTASKEGYKTINKKIQFGVIETEANIQYSEPRAESSKSYLTKGILYASIGIIILIILFWLYKRKQ